jgi:uncharacterized tellurite resistance protein B-like protein
MRQTWNKFIASLAGSEALPAQQEKLAAKEPLIMLGALLSKVAAADGHIAAAEEKEIRKVLKESGHKRGDIALVLQAAEKAIENSVDLHGFTKDFARIPYEDRLELLDKLFRVAAADHDLANRELEKIRRISKLLWITQRDFTTAKVKAHDLMDQKKK